MESKSRIKPEMSYGEYHARDWANGRSMIEIQDEIERCEERYLQPYAWNSVECAQNTIDRINALWDVIEEREATAGLGLPLEQRQARRRAKSAYVARMAAQAKRELQRA